jgi:hypothetical protein
MIEKFEDLDLQDVDTMEQVADKIREKLGVSIEEMQQALSSHVVEKAEALTHEFVNIAPLGDYSKLLEDNDSMAEFLKTEGHKPEHWVLYGVRQSDVNENLISFKFFNKIDELLRIPLIFIPVIAIMGLAPVFLAIGCTEEARHNFAPTSTDEVNNISYYKDNRTNLCFAKNVFQNGTSMFNEYIYVNVPCTPEVEKLIK